MKRWHRAGLAGVVIGGLMIAGCRQAPPPLPPPPPAVWQVPAGRSAQARELAQRTDQFEQTLRRLPGATADDHRQIVAAALDTLAKILHLAEGTPVPPDFTNRVAVVEGAQSVLSQSGIPRPRMEAVENEGARAALGSLEQIIADHLSNDDGFGPLLDAAREKVRAMDYSHGPMHDLDASAGLRALAQVVRRVSDDLSAEFGAPGPNHQLIAPGVPAVPPTTNPGAGPS